MASERQRFGAIPGAAEEAVRSGSDLPDGGGDSASAAGTGHGPQAHDARFSHKPTWAQTRYLIRGLKQPGGKLPLFDDEGQEIDIRTIRSCIERGWAEPWFKNPIKKDWLVCKLTAEGYKVLGSAKPKA
jgi:hypothetical protein